MIPYSRFILSFPSRGSLPKETIAQVCDAVRTELVNLSLTKYVNSILTAYVVKTPPDHDSGLALLLRLRGKTLTSSTIFYPITTQQTSILISSKTPSNTSYS